MIDILEGVKRKFNIWYYTVWNVSDHDILMTKLQKYGIKENEILWFKSYLSDRTQFVRCESSISTSRAVRGGVPQGTVLGPLLFMIFVNDFPNSLRSSQDNMFADDTICYAQGTTTTKEEVQHF